jgi:hypothetical protein
MLMLLCRAMYMHVNMTVCEQAPDSQFGEVSQLKSIQS